MKSSFDEVLIEVWRQALVENVNAAILDGNRCPVRRTAKRGLQQVDFILGGNEIRRLEQNPETKSLRAQMARSGKKEMQFPSEGRHAEIVVDGKVALYER